MGGSGAIESARRCFGPLLPNRPDDAPTGSETENHSRVLEKSAGARRLDSLDHSPCQAASVTGNLGGSTGQSLFPSSRSLRSGSSVLRVASAGSGVVTFLSNKNWLGSHHGGTYLSRESSQTERDRGRKYNGGRHRSLPPGLSSVRYGGGGRKVGNSDETMSRILSDTSADEDGSPQRSESELFSCLLQIENMSSDM
jgi:hypothetical protein